MPPRLSLVIPVYNGGPYLAESLAAAWAWLEAWPQGTELVVVEDGSGDGSRAIIEGFEAGLPGAARARVQVLVNDGNRGKGYSVRRGMLAARGDLRVYLDADLAFPLDNLPRLVAALEAGADVVLSSRTHPDSEYLVRCDQVGYAKRRHFMGRVFNWLVRALVVDGFGDTQAGQKGLTAAACARLFPDVRLERFAFDVELLWLARGARPAHRGGAGPVLVPRGADDRALLRRHGADVPRPVPRAPARAPGPRRRRGAGRRARGAMSRLALFAPCFVDQLWPEAGVAAVRLLEALGHEVALGEAACCGQVLGNAGDRREADRLRRLWAGAHAAFDEVVVLGASCLGDLRAGLGGGGPRLSEFCEWMLEHGPARFPKPLRERVAVHQSCSSLHETRTAAHLRALLGRVDGLEPHYPARVDECCGFGGSFASTFAELSVRMGRDKLADLGVVPGPDTDAGSAATAPPARVVSADCSCLLHLRGLAPAGARFVHVAELLAEAAL
ncbi:MAG: glycosyltransferase [Planctomycetota bacterium]